MPRRRRAVHVHRTNRAGWGHSLAGTGTRRCARAPHAALPVATLASAPGVRGAR
ncbi:hypothetical protein GLE_3346 [Lysobacter enzymogenes]|uniref:Uncharacterized protein n=1 Tax=Lysobacter enzymogenes TaxID=69 RepID=A0A0S2DJI7_LYSEN|nr:hypothetical protein GLE_3346 [Lysobacter enzymogenes]